MLKLEDEEGDDLSHWNTAEQMTENMAWDSKGG